MATQKVAALWIGANKETAEEFEASFLALDPGGFTLATRSTVQDALCELSSAPWSLAFFDASAQSLKDSDWDEDLQRLSLSLPIVLVVNNDSEDFVFFALKNGAVDYIHAKDTNPNSLLKTVRHTITNFHLLSELKKARQHDAMLKEQFLASQKMEAVGRLALGVAHDFNNLLTVIMNYAQMLQKSASDESTRSRIDAISNCANRAASITSQFLAFGRRNKPSPQVVSLNSVLSVVEPLLKQSLGSQTELRVAQFESGLSVLIDPGHLMHVILAMAQNAQDDMLEGGSLSINIATNRVDKHRSADFGNVAEGDYVVISVSDTGKGLDPETTEHIFELFGGENNDGNAPASLSAIYGIIKHAGGHIHVQSQLGKGSQFDIFLPRHLEEDVLSAEEVESEKPKTLGTILVVDDEEMVRKIAVEVIAKSGFRVLEAENAIEALKISEQRDEGIDLVLTDLMMPKMSGPELVQRMIAKHPNLRVVYMSGYSDDAFEHNRNLVTRESFVQKPFRPASLISAVNEALNRNASLSD